MPFEVDLGKPSLGFARTTALDGEGVVVQTRGFICADEALFLLRVLPGLTGELLEKAPSGPIHPPQVRSLLATYRRDGKATVWLNEITLEAQAQASAKIEVGGATNEDNLAEIRLVNLGVEVPKDSGVALIAHIGWERVLYFDFGPTAAGVDRDFDLARELGIHWTYVLHRQRLGISEEEWTQLLRQGWFPFILIPAAKVNLMLGLLRAGRRVDDALDDIASSVEPRLKDLVDEWKRSPDLEGHRPFLEKAIDHYASGDWISAISVLSPRIEGLMRSLGERGSGRAGHRELVASVIDAGEARLSPTSPILARRFKAYLNEVFLAPFTAEDPGRATRHPVTHGVAPVDAFDKKHALLCILIFHQLMFFAEPAPKTPAVASP